MDNYLFDYEALGKFVDELMKAKSIPVNSPEDLNALREEYIKKLDDRISDALFGSLSDEQLQEIDVLLDQDDGTTERYEEFFSNANINVEQIIANTLEEFKNEFLGGANGTNSR